MSIRRFFRKVNVIITSIALVTLLSGTAIYAAEFMNNNKEHKVDLHTSANVDISKQMVFKDAEVKLGENPEFQGTFQVHVTGVPKDSVHTYKLHTAIKVYEDEQCEREIQHGFKVNIIDDTKALNSMHDIHITLTIKDSSLGGKQVFVKAFSKLEKV